MLYRVTIEGETVEVELTRGNLHSVNGETALLGVPIAEWSVEPLPDGYLLVGGGHVVELCIANHGAFVASGARRASTRVLAPHDVEYGSDSGAGASDQELRAPMPGKVVKIAVAEGDNLTEGDLLVVIEAMKMQNELRARADCRVAQICAKEGQSVEGDALLLSFDPPED